ECTKDEIIGQHQCILHPPQQLNNGLTRDFPANLSENKKITAEDCVITKSGEIKHVEITTNTIITKDKKIINGIFRDITAKKTAELELARRINLEKTVNNIAKTISQVQLHNINEHITAALGTMGKTLNFDRAYVFMFSPDKKYMSNTHEWCAPNIEPQINNLQNLINADFNKFIHAINSDELLDVRNVADLPDDWGNEKQLFENQDIKSLIAMPIRYRGALVGFSGFDVVQSKPSWTSNDTATLNTFNEILAATLERQRFEERLDYATNYDQLTKLPNRLKFETTAQKTLNNSKTNNRNFALLYIDIDNFKEINSTHGHYTGDLVLQKIAHRLKDNISNKNFVGRLRSDKFIVIANNLNNQNEATIIAQNILDHIKPAFQINNEQLKITTSIGIAYYPKDGSDIASLLKQADKAMYNAKREGRNNFKFTKN
ncbi:MAG: diguanylate cyclase, partial [Gammaproteobacteria bacterium]|nr:diguanylate cyclase [Gammaproteobacteria bacterium]